MNESNRFVNVVWPIHNIHTAIFRWGHNLVIHQWMEGWNGARFIFRHIFIIEYIYIYIVTNFYNRIFV